ncbi:MAG: hypothetical protein GY791_20180 [Alphaproteobacteria bacterium]|nr:hypothetical protein [Alphaproteobacteria bacterium]
MIDNTYRLQARTQMLWQKAVSLRAVVDTHPENPGLMPPAVYPGETADWIRTTVNPIWNRFGLNRAYDEANAADTVARQAFTDMWKVEPRTIEGAIAKLKVAAHVVHGKLMDGELPLDSLHPELWVNEVSRDLADQAISELEAVWRVS